MFASCSHRVVARECQAYCTSRTALESAMDRPGVADEICAGPRVSRKKLERKQVAFEPIARPACNHKVARIVSAAAREWKDVVERGGVLIEMSRAVYTALAAVTQGGSSHRAFERRMDHATGAELHQMLRP